MPTGAPIHIRQEYTMKKTLLAFVCAALLGLPVPLALSADPPELLLTVSVPERWSVGLVSPDGACAISVFAQKDDGTQTLGELADTVASQFGGVKPKKVSDTEYSIDYTEAGTRYTAFVSLKEGTFYLITMEGEHPDAAAIITAIHYLSAR